MCNIYYILYITIVGVEDLKYYSFFVFTSSGLTSLKSKYQTYFFNISWLVNSTKLRTWSLVLGRLRSKH